MRRGTLILLGALTAAAPPALAVEKAVLDRFMEATVSFNEIAERGKALNRPPEQMREEAECILNAMDEAGGDPAVESLIVMVETLVDGGHVGSPEVVSFRETYGQAYMRAVGPCSAEAGATGSAG